MKLLLDTHIAVWAVLNPDRLSKVATNLLLDPTNAIYFSHVSLWEIAVKRSKQRLSSEGLPETPQDAAKAFLHAGFRQLRIRYGHICAVADLPDAHGDPFDRLLVAQAINEPMRLVTHERRLAAYTDTVIIV